MMQAVARISKSLAPVGLWGQSSWPVLSSSLQSATWHSEQGSRSLTSSSAEKSAVDEGAADCVVIGAGMFLNLI